MKSIMYTNSAKDVDGVASFSFEDTINFGSNRTEQLNLFSRPLDDLCGRLSAEYHGQQVEIRQLCHRIMCDPTNSFVAENVKEALRRLESAGSVRIDGRKRATQKGKVTMPDGAFATFLR